MLTLKLSRGSVLACRRLSVSWQRSCSASLPLSHLRMNDLKAARTAERARFYREQQRILGVQAAAQAIRRQLPDGVLQREAAEECAKQLDRLARKLQAEIS